MRPIEKVIEALRAGGFEPKKSPSGYLSRCPAHEDHHPSLGIGIGSSGRVLFRCYSANCEARAIAEKIGLRLADLFDGSETSKTLGAATSTSRATQPSSRRLFETASEAVRFLEDGRDEAHGLHRRGPRSNHWIYRTAQRVPIGLIVRWNLAEGKKIVLPVSRDSASGKWYVGAMETPRPIWRLPDVLEADPSLPLLVTEGEKAAEAADRLGFIATTAPMGAQAVGRTEWQWSRGREIVISVDRDDAGEAYGRAVAEKCKVAGARRIDIIRLADAWPLCPEGGDIADLVQWLTDPQEAIGFIERLIAKARGGVA